MTGGLAARQLGNLGVVNAPTKAGEKTKERLVRTVLELASEGSFDDIKVEDVLASSGVSTGSLYHHFEDFDHLIETAMVERYVELQNAGFLLVGSALDEAEDRDDLERRLVDASVAYLKLNTPEVRFDRARILAAADRSERLRGILGEAQQELTDSLAGMFARAQRPEGLLDPELDPRAIAVLVQAYTFGRVVDDVVPEPMEQTKWLELVLTVFMRGLVPDPAPA